MTYRKKISCSTSNLKTIRDFVTKVLTIYNKKGCEISNAELHLLVVAVDEVCANLMIHNHKENPDEDIEVVIMRKGKELVFEIHDQGEKFDMTKYQSPKVSELIKEKKSGGMGLILVKKIIDRGQVETIGSKNI